MMFLAKVLGTGFGTGLLPYASGTAASLLALGMYFGLTHLIPHDTLWLWLLIGIGVLTPIGIWSGGKLEEIYGRDPRQATIDEIVGQWVALIFLPVTPFTLVLSFVFFRFYDIAKPEPVNQLQRLPGGFGIVADDIMAGVYANLSTWVILWVGTYFSLIS